MRILILGAGGPVAQTAIDELAGRHDLRLTDLEPLDFPEHETQMVDVTDYSQVYEATEGVDAVINCTVMRPHPTLAWDVNVRGAYNALKAAARHGVKRFVHTGPIAMWGQSPGCYQYDWDVSEDSPPRPGTNLYFITKYCALELCRVFADRHDLSVVAFHYNGFGPSRGFRGGALPFGVHPEDAGQAFRLGIEVENLPNRFELFHISSEYSHDQFPTTKAEELLGFEPRHRFSKLYLK